MDEKIKLVIIDDELSARSMIKNLLKDSDLYEVAADFGDSAMATEWLEEHHVDIVLMDMNMPKINGVELIQMICAGNADIHFIAISGYEDFEYVRGCLKNNRVADYLLKHQLTKEGLIHSLDEMQRRYMIKPHQQNQKSDESIQEIFENEDLTETEIREMAEQAHIHFPFSDMVMLYLSLDAKLNQAGKNGKLRANASMVMEDIVKQTIIGKHAYMMYHPDEKDMVVLISFANIKSYQYILNTQTVIIRRIQKMTERLLNTTVTVWVGKIQAWCTEALKEFRCIRKKGVEKLYNERGSVIFHVLADKEERKKVYLLTDEDGQDLRCELSLRKEEGVYAKLKFIFDEIRKHRCDKRDVILICKKILQLVHQEYGAEIMSEVDRERSLHILEELDFIEQYEEYMWEILKWAVKKKKETFEQKYDPVITKTIDYINEHFSEELTLEDCAVHAGVSYTHLSRSFKKAIGIRFTEYLNQIRVDHAKNLLGQGRLSLKEIVAASGFSNYNYFFKVFKELVGVSPNEYYKQSKNP